MVFKRLLGSLGVGGPSVDTVLTPGATVPGGPLSGEVHLHGGRDNFDIQHITLELVARVEAEHDGTESAGNVVFDRVPVGGGFRLTEGEQRRVPFTVTLPWETPVTELHGQPLGAVLALRTELAVAGAKDSGDLDPLAVRPLPAQEAVLEALGQLGFGFRSTDLEYGHIGGTGQQLPFYQEIELTPPPRYAHAIREIEVTFLAGPSGVDVLLEADKRGRLLTSGHDTLTRFTVSHHDVAEHDWNAEADAWIQRLVEHRSAGHRRDHGGHSSGIGMGVAVAAGTAGLAVGVVGGMAAAEVIDEVGDFFEGDEEEEG